jgi:hypothetical protein
MATGYEVQMYNDIKSIAQSLNRIANCMEAAEKRAREREDNSLAGSCHEPYCDEPVIAMINGQRWCQLHIENAFIQAAAAVHAGMTQLEKQVQKEGQ